MKILWHSNAAWAPSGYGNQTGLFARLLQAAGHEVNVSAFYGLRGASLRLNGVENIPGGLDPWGNDILGAHHEHYKPDVLVALMDIWVLEKDVLEKVPVTAWAPVDHDPIPPKVLEHLRLCKHIFSMSRFGDVQMRRRGLQPFYVPHGVDTEGYAPKDRAAARRMLGVWDGWFFAVSVAANKGVPSRKHLDKMLKAWGQFCRKYPKSLLYLHTEPSGGGGGGLDLFEIAKFYEIPPLNLRFPDVYRMLKGEYGTRALNELYNAADVFLLPSAGEGFGIPVVEAQAAGCPVIVSDFTAQSELAGPGYKIPVAWDDREYTAQFSEQAHIRAGAIVEALEWARDSVGDEKLRAESRAFAMGYDARVILRDYMLPAMVEIAGEGEGRERRTGERLNRRDAERAEEEKREEEKKGFTAEGAESAEKTEEEREKEAV